MVTFLDLCLAQSANNSCLCTQQMHNTLCPPRPLLFLLLFLRGNLKDLRPPVMRRMCSRSCTYLSSIQACPTSIPGCPAEESGAAGPSKGQGTEMASAPERQVWCLSQAQHTHSRYQVHNSTPKPVQGRGQSTISPEHGSG